MVKLDSATPTLPNSPRKGPGTEKAYLLEAEENGLTELGACSRCRRLDYISEQWQRRDTLFGQWIVLPTHISHRAASEYPCRFSIGHVRQTALPTSFERAEEWGWIQEEHALTTWKSIDSCGSPGFAFLTGHQRVRLRSPQVGAGPFGPG